MEDRAARLRWFMSSILPYEGEVRSRLRRLCPSGYDVDNLVAESLARAYAAKDVERVAHGRGYLFGIARNLLLDALRRDTIVSLDFVADLDLLRSESSLDAELSARDALRRLIVIVEGLPPQPRRVFVMRRVHDCSPGEIAAQMGLSVSTVEKHLAKAIRLVAKGLAQLEDVEGERPPRTQAGPSRARRTGLGLRRRIGERRD